MRTPPWAISSVCYGSGRTGISARSTAVGFAEHLNSVLNQTVSDSRLTLLPRPHGESIFELTRFVGGESTPLELHGTPRRLFIRQIVEVVDGHCQVEYYAYRLQDGEDRKSWLIRWEYHRRLPVRNYPYALAHVHLNGQFVNGDTTERLHIPTRRVPLELVLWHLISEWGVDPKIDGWQGLLKESIEGFDERRTTS